MDAIHPLTKTFHSLPFFPLLPSALPPPPAPPLAPPSCFPPTQRTFESQCDHIGSLQWVPFHYTTPFPPPRDRCRLGWEHPTAADCCQTIDLAWEQGVASIETHVAAHRKRIVQHRNDEFAGPVIDLLAKLRDLGAAFTERDALLARCKSAQQRFRESWWWKHSLSTDPHQLQL